MTTRSQNIRFSPETDAQEAYLAIEVQPADEAEKERLLALRKHIAAHTHQADLRNLAPDVRELMGEGYQVGCGSSHIWLRRGGSTTRLAIVTDRLSTAYRDWYEPPIPTGPRPSSRPEDNLPIPGQELNPTSTPTQ